MKNPAIFTPGETPGVPPEIQMLRLASGHVAAQAIYVFAQLGIADLLRGGALASSEIATQVEAHTATLDRVLRFLATLDVVQLQDDGRFALTRLGQTLCKRPSGAIRDNTLLMGSPNYWDLFGDLLHMTKTGDVAFEHTYGQHYFSYLSDHPEEAKVFNNAMSSSVQMGTGPILAEYSFADCQTVIDVGGGEGGLITAILKKNPGVHGTLLDAPEVVSRATIDPTVADRLTVTGGSFFKEVPTGLDAYVLRRILHDWDDRKCVDILRVVRKAMGDKSKLVIVELAAPETGESENNWRGLDLIMMLKLGGREREEHHFRELFAASGFALSRIVRTKSAYWVVEALPV